MNNGNSNKKQLGKQFEQQFKNTFENAQFIPPAHLWEQIDAALDAKPWYKRPLFYWTSGLVAALLLVVMFWFTLFYDGLDSPSSTTIVDSDKDKIENTLKNGIQDNIENESTRENNNETSDIDNSSSKNSTNGIRTIQMPNDSGLATLESNPVVEDKLVFNSSQDNSDKKIENTNSNVNSSILIDNSKKDINLTAINFQEIDWSKYLPVGNPYFEQEEVIIKIDSTKEVIANNKSENQTENIKKSSGIAITFGINHTQGIYQPSFRTDSIFAGLTVIEAFSSNLADTLPQTNINGTYQQTGFDIALAFGKNKRWSINSGLAMGKANYSFGSTNFITVSDIAGSNLREFADNQVEVNYEWLQVPIAVGYQFGESRAKKFTGFAQLGTAIEFLNSYSYLSADPLFTYAIGKHRTTNTQVWTQAGVNFHITNRWILWGGATYKSSLSSLINENGVTFSSQAYGWQVGTRFTIFEGGK